MMTLPEWFGVRCLGGSPWEGVRLALFALLACAAPGVVGAQPADSGYTLGVWASEKGSPPGDVFSITQDFEGYLWLGTPTGLLRFDGSRFTPWTPADASSALPNGPVHALVSSHDGSLWVGLGGGGGVVRIYQGRAIRHSTDDGAPAGVTAMIQDRKGTIWVANRRGLYRFADDRWTLMGQADGLGSGEVSSLYEDSAGRLWTGTATGVYMRAKDSFELVDPSLPNIQSLTEDGSGAIWVTDSGEILKKLSTHTSPHHTREVRLPTGAWRVLRDTRGQIWAAAFGGGLLRVRNPLDRSPIIERFEFEHRLAGSPRSLYEDRDGNIWVGMRGGLLRLSARSFSSAAPLEGLTNDGVRTAAVGADGGVWVATGHGINHFTGSARSAYSFSQTMVLHTDRHGTLWVAGAQRLGRLVNGRFDDVAVPDVVRTSRIMALTTDAQDTMWLCTALKGVMSWDGKALSRFDGQTDVAGLACQSILADSQGRIWIGLLTGGAALYNKGTFERFTERDGLTRGTVLSIVEDQKGAVWLSTSGGVSRIQDGRITSVTVANAPLTDLVPVLVEDLEGYIWVGVNSGAAVIRFHPSEVDKIAANPSYQLEYALYDESDGMQQGSQTWQSGVGGVRGGDGRLWVATGLGMTVIDPARLPPPRRPPPPRIEGVVADGRRVMPGRNLTLPTGTSTLRIEYGTASLSSASKLRFRHMLEGLDDEWVYAGSVREATYNSVPPGDYRFRVSTTANGEWTEAAHWEFSVAQPIYRTRTFVVLFIAGTVLMLAAAWWLRLRTVRNQYALVFAERARVSREIHDTLLQSLAAIGVELETIATQLDESQVPARDGLRRLRRQVVHCLREARESILELRNNSMKPRALVDLLQELADNTTQRKGIPTEFSVSGKPRPCSGDADVQLLRIAQEAVNNAAKHGRARHIRITLDFQQDRLLLTVADDGCGFQPDEHDPAPALGEHLGLLTMRERAARIRGHLALISKPGNGTTIEAAVPLGAE